ncbi:MAG: Rne/Rng family ribonuclease, partial [Firmicutes bacterium]|nr:Rne/Rng family ribonuclease [Bacillota bacterium]
SGADTPSAACLSNAIAMPDEPIYKELLISCDGYESRLAVVEDGELVEFHRERIDMAQAAGNIYKGRVENILPGMRAAFVNLGLERNGFLYVDDAHAKDRDHMKGRAIQDVLHVGQEIVVQVVKEPIGNKGARITTHVSLPGRYVVLTPYSDIIGVSRRIESPQERERLRTLAEHLRPLGMGMIVRTVAEGVSQRALLRDIAYLRRLWSRIRYKARTAHAPALLHHEASLIARTIRDHLDTSVNRVIMDEAHAYARAYDIATAVSPRLRNRLELYQGDTPLFQARGMEVEIDRALKKRVWLKCGGYLIIEETEALTVIDVNTGKNVGTTDLADTVLDTNKEAAVEIARQLRLRDISGIVIVDFIDMESEADQTAVIQTFQQSLRSDRTRVTVLGMTRLGLLEMTRKKVRESLLNQMTHVCAQCEGRGHVLAEDVVARRLRYQILEKLRETGAEATLVEVNPAVASHLIGPGGAHLREMERMSARTIYVRGAVDCAAEELRFVVLGSRETVEERALPVREGDELEVIVEQRHATNNQNGIARVAGYVIDIQNAGNLVGTMVHIQIIRALKTFAVARIVPASDPAVITTTQTVQ